MGIYTSAAAARIRGQESRACTGPFWDCDGLSVAIVQDADRPLSSVAHELGHLLGRKHASAANGADDPEDWPPDQQGFLEGVGYDRNASRVLFQARSDIGTKFFDIMGYNGINGANDPDKWISIRGWNEELGVFVTGPPRVESALAGSSTTASKRPSIDFYKPAVTLPMSGVIDGMVVHAMIDADGAVTITKLAPTFNRNPMSGKPSVYKIVVQDKKSEPLYIISPLVVTGDSHRAPDTYFLEAVISIKDWDLIGAVEVHSNEKAIFRRERPKAGPIVSDVAITAPDANSTEWRVAWKSSHPTGAALSAKLDYSWDAGSTYRSIYAGPDRSSTPVALPPRYFPTADQALLRIRVSDGFNLTTAVSSPFKSAGLGPSVRIVQPKRCGAYRKGCAIYLHGTARDEMRVPMLDSSLKWYVGERSVGSGVLATLRGPEVRPGAMMIRLEATDGRGRKEVASVEICC